MKNTGIIRRVDELGRIIIPVELRRNLGLKEKDSVEIFAEGNLIVLKKYEEGCAICGSSENLKIINNIEGINGKAICKECAVKISEIGR